jgi:hypothetical protein
MGQDSFLRATILRKEASVPMQQMQIGPGVAPRENRKIAFLPSLTYLTLTILISSRRLCGSWGQTCSGAGNLAGTGQLFCQSGNTSKTFKPPFLLRIY